MANLVFNSFENEAYGFEESGHTLEELTKGDYGMTSDTDQDESNGGARRLASLQSSNSLAPLLTRESPVPVFNSARFETVEMPQSGTISTQSSLVSNGNLSPPPLPHFKSHPRVFSKKGKGLDQGSVPIPGPRTRPALDITRSPEEEGWEMSARDSTDSGLRSGSLESPSSPQEWCFSRQFDIDRREEEEGCSYLKPLESPTLTQPESGEFTFSENNVCSPTDSRREFTPPFRDTVELGQNRRFDSGIGDSDSEHGSSRRKRTASEAPSSTSASSSYPRLARLSTHPEQHYEDIDAYKKYVMPDKSETLENMRPANGSVLQGRSQLPVVNISGVTHTESRDHASATTTQSHPMVRPYLDPRTASLPHTYSHLENNGYMIGPKVVESDKTRSCCCGLVIVLVLIFVMSAAALSVGIYLVINDELESSSTSTNQVGTLGSSNNSGLAKTLSMLEEKIAELQKDLVDLQRENTNLKADLGRIKDDVSNEVQPLYKEVSYLRNTQRDTNQSMTVIENRLTSRIDNISLTPGPQGPVGVANFSLCLLKSSAQSADSSNVSPTISPLLPNDRDIQDHVAIFAYCTMTGAQKVQLEFERSLRPTISDIQYKCVCTGTESGVSRTRCEVNAILCPKQQRVVP